MINLYSVPRINALGKKGPEKSSKLILEGYNFESIDTKNENISEDQDKIYEIAKKGLNKKCLFVGGDHSITFPIAKSFLEKYDNKNSFMIVFDAHADFMIHQEEPTHEEIFEALVSKGWDPKKIIFIGLRKIEPEEKELMDKLGINYYKDYNEFKENFEEIKKKIQKNKVYLSIDIDCVDPTSAPGVNYPEEKGMNTKELFDGIDLIKNNFEVRVYDLVEIVLEKDDQDKTLKLAKEIVKKIIQ